jgi:mRNA interferase RelE/StbE
MGGYKIELKLSAAKELKSIQNQEAKRLINAIQSLSENPRPAGCKKLSGEEKYRIREGNYRILYEISDKKLIVYVVKVGHRKDVYEK